MDKYKRFKEDHSHNTEHIPVSFGTPISLTIEQDDAENQNHPLSADAKLEFQKAFAESDGGTGVNNGQGASSLAGIFINPDEDKKKEPETLIEKVKFHLIRVLDHLAFRLFTVVLVIIDLILVIIDLAHAGDTKALEICSLIIMTYFMVEIILRVFAHGPTAYVKNWIELIDGLIVVISFVLGVVFAAMGEDNTNVDFGRLVVAGRLIRIVLIVRLVSERKHLQQATRQVVSQNKRRYQKDGFDLDLCYITNRVIAMSFPSTGVMAMYRNPIQEVARFLEIKHKDHYRVYNLCSERMYDESMFKYCVERVRIDDHNVPKLADMLGFANNARQWLAADEDNVIAVHCKGGKGRTGTMICVTLIESGAFEEAEESLEYFGDRRTDLSVGSKFQGVETPSQGRYVGYFEQLKKVYNNQMPPSCRLILTTITIKNVSGLADGDGRDLSCRVITQSKIYEYDLGRQLDCKVEFDNTTSKVRVMIIDPPAVEGDVKVMFHSSSPQVPKNYDDCAFYFWLHTSFIKDNKLWLPREELDNPHKEKTWSVFREGFGVELQFSPCY